MIVGDTVRVLPPFEEWFPDAPYVVTAVSNDGQCVSILVNDVVRDFDPMYLESV